MSQEEKWIEEAKNDGMSPWRRRFLQSVDEADTWRSRYLILQVILYACILLDIWVRVRYG